MIFAHGFGCDHNMWRFVAPQFEDEYRVVLFDHVGAGGSDLSAYSPERYASLHGYADDVLQVLDEVQARDAVFVGHSVSAMIGVLAAISAPDRFRQLVLVGPSPRYIDDDGYRGGFSEADIVDLLESLDSNYLGWDRSRRSCIPPAAG
jgi:sigma-B regulation protein RsbQ